jgi:hypothetical protein
MLRQYIPSSPLQKGRARPPETNCLDNACITEGINDTSLHTLLLRPSSSVWHLFQIGNENLSDVPKTNVLTALRLFPRRLQNGGRQC